MYAAEAEAGSKAIDCFHNLNLKSDDCEEAIIFTDRLSFLQEMISGRLKSLSTSKIHEKFNEASTGGIRVKVAWIPDHVGLDGNESAGNEAKKYAIKDRAELDLPWDRGKLKEWAKSYMRESLLEKVRNSQPLYFKQNQNVFPCPNHVFREVQAMLRRIRTDSIPSYQIFHQYGLGESWISP